MLATLFAAFSLFVPIYPLLLSGLEKLHKIDLGDCRAEVPVSETEIERIQKVVDTRVGRHIPIDWIDLYDQPTAYSFKFFKIERIVLNAHYIKYFRNDDELAFVVFHELGHLVFYDTDLFNESGSEALRAEERAADIFSVELMIQTGYNPRSATRVLEGLFWKQLIRDLTWRDREEASDTHPSDQDRIDNIKNTFPDFFEQKRWRWNW